MGLDSSLGSDLYGPQKRLGTLYIEAKKLSKQSRGEDPWKRKTGSGSGSSLLKKPDPDPDPYRIRIQAKLDYLSEKYGGLFHLIIFSDSPRFFMLI